MADLDFPRLILKLRFYLNANSDDPVAKALGMVSTSALRERRRHNNPPIDQLKVFCQREGLDYETFIADCKPGAIPFKQGPAKNVAAVEKLPYIIKNGTENERLLIIGRLSEMSESIKFRKKMEK